MKASALQQVHLKPGELIVCQEPRLVGTILGSCVAVTMYHARSRLAAMCHAMLPEPKHKSAADAEPGLFRYVNQVIPVMCGYFESAGGNPGEVEVKLFGGGNVIEMEEEPASERWIGSANVRHAREMLAQCGFTIRASNVGGTNGRKILFNTATGEVMHKHLGHKPPKRLP